MAIPDAGASLDEIELCLSQAFGAVGEEMPLMTNSNNGPLYRMMFLMRHPLAERLWVDVARGQKRVPDLFGE